MGFSAPLAGSTRGGVPTRKGLEPRRVLSAPPGGPNLAPGAVSLTKNLMQRLFEDVVAVAGAPLRFFQLAKITKDVVADVKGSRLSSTPASEPKSNGGASETLQSMIPDYMKSHVIARTKPQDYRQLLTRSLNVFIDSITAKEPYPFRPFHQAVRGPEMDFYSWGNDFFRPLVKYRSSRVEGLENVELIKEKLAAGENVVLLANHQTEADPQVLSILLELYGHSDIAERTIFVAGHKVTTDPVAVPFSMGRNLLTIFSKKYMDTFSEEEKEAKSARNRETVVEMQRLLSEGGNILWVAPSGGRDRKSPDTGRFVPAKFDPQSIGLFQILAKKAARSSKKKTNFVPLGMWTHRLVPPPDDAQAQVGETRSMGLKFGAPLEVNGRQFPAHAEGVVGDIYAELDASMRQ